MGVSAQKSLFLEKGTGYGNNTTGKVALVVLRNGRKILLYSLTKDKLQLAPVKTSTLNKDTYPRTPGDKQRGKNGLMSIHFFKILDF